MLGSEGDPPPQPAPEWRPGLLVGGLRPPCPPLRSQEKARQDPGVLEQHQKRDVAVKRNRPDLARSSSSGVTSVEKQWEGLGKIPWEELCDVDPLGILEPLGRSLRVSTSKDQASFRGQGGWCLLMERLRIQTGAQILESRCRPRPAPQPFPSPTFSELVYF